jgi:chromosome segregation ATPase
MTPNPVPSIPSREAVDELAAQLEICAGLTGYADRETVMRDSAKSMRDLLVEVERLTKFNKDMVAKAAEGSLDGYRELGQRAAQAENERDSLRATVAQQAEALAAVQKDADRYRYLRGRFDDCSAQVDFAPDDSPWVQVGQNIGAGKEFDEAIDAALSNSSQSVREG